MTYSSPWGLICCICFRGLTSETCVVDSEGVKWDICPGKCARDAGVVEQDEDCFNCGPCHDCAICDPEYYI